MKRTIDQNKNTVVMFKTYKESLEGTIVKASRMRDILNRCGFPKTNNFWTTFRKVAPIKEIKRGYYQITNHITLKGVEALYTHYTHYNRSFA